MLEGSSFMRKRIDKYGWVDVTNNPFNLRDLFRSLLLDLYYYSESTKAKESTEFGLLGISDPIQECCKFLRAYKCLIVLDGLQSTAGWDLIKAALASGPSYPSCTVIVITNEASVAKHCSMHDEGMVCSVNGLDADAALGLFKEVCGEAATKDDYIEEAKLILSKCGGLPKVIVTIGASLATTSIWNWRYMKHNLMHELETNLEFESVQGLFAWMNSYFHTCPDFLKPCIFYLTVFPRDHSIRRRRLVRRWIAEGYSRDTDDGTTEENGEMFFTKLVELSMIQQPTQAGTTRRRMVLCQVNGFLREYVNSRPMEDNLVLTLEGRCSLNSQRTGRHLAIGSSWDRDRIVFESIDFSRLRSLTVFGKWESFFISETMKVLRVLDLEDASDVTDDDLEQIVVRLPRLKFLSLRRCTEICRLPDSLGDLRQLQTLDVRHTSVVALPPAIIKLRKLQYIRAGTAIPIPSDDDDTDASLPAAGGPSTPSRRSGLRAPLSCRRHRPVEVPRGIGELTALHTLGVVNVSDAGGEAILKELKKLTQLRKLGVSGVNQRNSQLLCSAISGHGHLESLSVRLEYEEESFYACLDGVSPPPENLETLKLNGNVDRFPEWIKQVPFLRLCFHVGTSVQDIPIRDLEELLVLGNRGSGRELWPRL